MAFWLFKSEPDAYSWAQMQKDGVTDWTGVRNHQAAANMKAMRAGDLGFFYHSNAGREIVGIVRVIAEAAPDKTDPTGRFCAVRVETVCALPRPVTLGAIKSDKALEEMPLVRQSRLSVSPVGAGAWNKICAMGGISTTDINRMGEAA